MSRHTTREGRQVENNFLRSPKNNWWKHSVCPCLYRISLKVLSSGSYREKWIRSLHTSYEVKRWSNILPGFFSFLLLGQAGWESLMYSLITAFIFWPPLKLCHLDVLSFKKSYFGFKNLKYLILNRSRNVGVRWNAVRVDFF